MTRVVVAGVAGSGKTTVGRVVARVLGWPFVDGDDLHSTAGRAAMAAGTPLRDDERDLWIERLRSTMAQHGEVVIACSALRRRHRRRLWSVGEVQMFFLDVPVEELVQRLRARPAHFFPASLLASQIATLDPVGSDEGITVVDGNRPVLVVAEEIVLAVTRG